MEDKFSINLYTSYNINLYTIPDDNFENSL